MNEPTTSTSLSIGQKVRIPINNIQNSEKSPITITIQKGTARAIIALIDNDEKTISIMWDDNSFIPHHTISNDLCAIKGVSFFDRKFYICPNTISISDDDTLALEEEIVIPLHSNFITPLLPFENEINRRSVKEKNEVISLSKKYKEQGDALFKLHDYTAAIEQYEAALKYTSMLSIGGKVFIEKNKQIVLAEVDCIDEDDIDVVIQNEECTIKQTNVILCHLNTDDAFQERILLNLSKALLNLGNIISAFGTNSSLQDINKSVVLACSIILAAATKKCNDDDERKTNATISYKALYIRAKAYLNLSKFQKATMDIKHILKSKPNDKDALNLSKEIQYQAKELKKSNKRLAKEVCQWVDHATKNSTVSVDENKHKDVTTVSECKVVTKKDVNTKFFIGSFLILFIAIVIVNLPYFRG